MKFEMQFLVSRDSFKLLPFKTNKEEKLTYTCNSFSTASQTHIFKPLHFKELKNHIYENILPTANLCDISDSRDNALISI